jgi:hypothetical protein
MSLTWTLIKMLGNNRFTRSAYIWLLITPILARLVEHLENPLSFNIAGQQVEIVTQLPFSWIVLYFAALVFSLAASVYLLFCPRLIQQYDNYGDFLHSRQPLRTLVTVFNKGLTYLSHRSALNLLLRIAQKYRGESGDGPSTSKATIGKFGSASTNTVYVSDDQMPEFFEELASLSEKLYPKAIYAAAGLYITGYALILVLLIQNLGYVLRQAI